MWVYINATLANPASNSCLLYYNVAANIINLAQNSGTAWADGYTGSCLDIAEQPVLAECGGHDGDAERQQFDAHPSDDVFTGLCRSEEHLLVRGRCVGFQQRVATTRHLDSTGSIRPGGCVCGAEFREHGEPNVHIAIFGHGGSIELTDGVGVHQRDTSQSGQQFLPAVLQRSGQHDQSGAKQRDGVGLGCTGGSHDIAEQPMLAECGGHDGDAEREQSDAHPSDDVFTSLCRGEEHLFVRGRCVGVQQRLATTRHLDGTLGASSKGVVRACWRGSTGQTSIHRFLTSSNAASLMPESIVDRGYQALRWSHVLQDHVVFGERGSSAFRYYRPAVSSGRSRPGSPQFSIVKVIGALYLRIRSIHLVNVV